MTTLGSATIRIRPDTSGFRAEANRSIGGAMKSIAKVGAIAFAAGAAGATVALAGMAKAAIADQQAQALLAKQLKNSAGATDAQVKATERWITAQGRALGVTDDELRPALAKLVTATGDVGKAQKLASLAMDVSAGTGKSLESVSMALMKAYNGNTAGLGKLGLATKNAKGEALTFEQATKKMAEQFGGAASTKAETLQGKMTRLKVIFDEAKESIGAKLIPMLTKLVDWIVAKVIPAVTRFGGFIKTNILPVVKEFAGELADRLQPVFARVRDVVAQFLPVLSRVAGSIKANFLPVIKTAAATFKTSILPAVTAVADYIGENLGPVLQRVGDVIRNDVVPIIAKFADFFVGTVIPAIVKLYSYIVSNLVPVFEQVADVISRRVVPIIAGLAGFIVGTLYPAIFKIYTAIIKNLKPVFDQLVTTVQTQVLPALAKLLIKFEEWRPTLQKVIEVVVRVVGAVLTFAAAILGKVLPVVIRFIGFLISKLVPAIIKVIDWMIKIGRVIVKVWNAVIQPALKAWWAYISKVLFPIIRFLYEHVVRPVFTSLGNKIRDVWNNSIKPTFTALKTGLTAIKDAFKTAVARIKTFWAGLKEAAAAPVRFVVNTVYNDGIRKVVNAIPGIPGSLPEITMATGGVLPGFTPGRDIHDFYSKTGGRLRLSGGEAIMRPEWVRQMGGPLAVDRMNKAARMGNYRKVGDVGAFKDGGTLDAQAAQRASAFAYSQVGKPYVWSGVGPGGYDCSGFMSAITNVMRGKYPYSRVGSTASFPWAGFASGKGKFTIGSTPNYGGSGVGHMAGSIESLNVESSGGQGVHLGAGARGYNDPGFSTHAHIGGAAGNIWDPIIAKFKELWAKMHAAVTKLATMGDWGNMMKDAVKSIASGIRDWINGKIPGSPVPAFDQGGVGRGRGSLLKNTMRPERVLSPRQTVAFERLVDMLERNGGAGGPLVNIDTVNTYDVHSAARAISAEQRKALTLASFA